MEITNSVFRNPGIKSKTIIKGSVKNYEAKNSVDFTMKLSASADKLLPSNITTFLTTPDSLSNSRTSDKFFKNLSNFSHSNKEKEHNSRPYLGSTNLKLPSKQKIEGDTPAFDQPLNNNDFIPPNMKGDFVYSNLKSLGEKKQVSDLEKWLETLHNKIQNSSGLSAEKKKNFEREMFTKGTEALMTFINRDHGDVSKLVTKIMNLALATSSEENAIKNEAESEAGITTALKKRIHSLENELSEAKSINESTKSSKAKISAVDVNKMDSFRRSKMSNFSQPDINSFKKRDAFTQTELLTNKKNQASQCSESSDQLTVPEKALEKQFPPRNSQIGFNLKLLSTGISEKFEIKIDKNGISQATEEEAREMLSSIKKKSISVYFPQDELLHRKSIEKKKIALVNEENSPRKAKHPSIVGMDLLYYSDLKQQTEELITLNATLGIYEREMKGFYEELQKIMNVLDKIPEATEKLKFETLKLSVQKNQDYNKQFIELLRARDTHQQEELMNLKIEIAERGQLQFEQEQINRNWKRRFDFFFQNFQRLKHNVAQDQENRDKLINTLATMKGLPKEATVLVEKAREFTPLSLAKIKSNVTLNVHAKEASHPLEGEKAKTKKKQLGGLSEVIGEFFVKGTLVIEMPFSFLNKKRIIRHVFSNNSVEAQKFIREAREIPLFPIEDLKVDQILKMTSAIYVLLVKQMKRRENENPLYFFVYDYFMNNFGGSAINVDKKFRVLIGSCLTFQEENAKVRMFLKLITIIHHDPYEFDGLDLIFYLDSMKHLDEENSKEPGLTLASNAQEKTWISYKSALDYGTSLFKQNKEMMRAMDLSEFQAEVNQIKIPHPSIQGRFNVEFDLFMELLFKTKFKYYCKRFELLFKAIDVEMQENIGFEQFVILLNLFEPKRFTLRGSLALFSKYVDLVDDDAGCNFLSFRQFAVCADNEGLFGFDSVEHLIKSNQDQIVDLQSLEIDWVLIKNLIRLKLIKSRSYSLYFQKLLLSFDYIFPLDLNDTDLEMMWVRYRIIDTYSHKIFMESIVKSCTTSELIEINDIFIKLEN